jgi:hypothetical protein
MATLEPLRSSCSPPRSDLTTAPSPPSPTPTARSFSEDDKDATLTPTNVRRLKAIETTTQEDKSTQSLRKKVSRTFLENRHVKNIGYYDEVFALREQGPAIPRSAGVCVELKTNIIVSPDSLPSRSLGPSDSSSFVSTK